MRYGGAAMDRRYRDEDPLAWALDLVGERWTVLVVRDLLLGPRRFTDLANGLPRTSRNLLTARLRRLEEEGLVRRRELPPPLRVQLYEATEASWDVARALLPLAIWGMRRLGPEHALRTFRVSSFAIGMVAFADRREAEGVRATCQFDVEGESFHLEIDDGAIRPGEGPAEAPAVTVTADRETCAEMMAGRLTAPEAVASGRMVAAGDPEVAVRLFSIFPPLRLPGDPDLRAAEARSA
jgi:DNA-binding HxlR family transcriptional regulator